MKLVIDLQGAQAANRSRGIGRYSLALARGIARHAGRHEIWVALNGGFADGIEDIRRSFHGLLPKERIAVWHAPARVASIDPANEWRRRVGERLREEFLASLRPDVVHITSLFEGLVDDALTSIGPSDGPTSTTVTLHDLIPLVHRNLYLKTPRIEAWYENKIAHLKRAPLLLANSESSRQEGIRWLKLPEQRILNISAAADDIFRPLALAAAEKAAIRRQYGLPRSFVMYTGGIELRKNIERLIQAYAALPAELRQQHQLAIVCQIEAADLHRLRALGRKNGLADDELVFTGRIPDDDLVTLYNECSVFVFPSWHEGFGLPALEAMTCGAAVIAANVSSLPEVVGRADALFDPLSERDIAAKLHAVLTDAGFREELKAHGLRQATKFSWDATAKRALEGLERLAAQTNTASRALAAKPRPSLAYISPLPPSQTGIADYSAELLRELHRHYEIDVVVAQKEISDDWVLANCAQRNVAQFRQNADRYDRILYHFGNSVFHQHMFDLLERHPGTVVLHDFYLSGILSNIELFDPGSWIRSLYESHGYAALRDPPRADNRIDIAYKFPCSLDVIRRANGVIVHSEFSRALADQWYGEGTSADWVRIPHLRQPETGANRAAARAALGFSEQDFVVCSFGSIGPTKFNDRLLTAWLSAMKGDQRCHLVFVGENQSSPYGAALLRAIDGEGLSERVKITGYASPELYRCYLATANCAVQLRSLFRGETSGAILDCLNYGIPTIVNAHGPIAELDPDAVLLLPDRFDDADLAAALSRIRQDGAFRRSLSERSRAYIAATHSPVRIGEQYREAIEHFAAAGPLRHRINLLRNLPKIDPPPRDASEWNSVARSLVLNHPLKTVVRNLFVDVSEFVATRYASGIQRVVRSVLNELLAYPPAGFRIEPVYTGADGVYRYARRFTVSFMGGRDSSLTDDVVDAGPGDVFIGLDYCPHLVPRSRRALEQMAQRGASIYFIVYDLLCIQRPEFFIPDERTVTDFVTWLNAISRHADGLIGISRSVANDLMQWLAANAGGQRVPRVGWFHLGSDIRASQQALSHEPGQSGELDAALLLPRTHPSVLMVGTIEPRKGYADVLAAFESLWHSGVEANLVIAGRRGWMTDALINHLLGHPMAGKRLFWFSEASDAMVLKLYDAADGLLMASEAEGFGLPLIEAARNGMPILARDIPVFREVAGEHATYFSARTPLALAEEIKAWLKQLAAGEAIPSRNMPWSTWAQSTTRLMELVLDSKNERWR